MSEMRLQAGQIEQWGMSAFTAAGVPANDAATIVKALIRTSLWGIDSHGVARMTHYLTRFENGTLTRLPDIQFHKTGAATGQVDGNDGHGIVIMTQATDHAIALAAEAGIGAVGVFNSSHCGAIGLYTRQIAAKGMVGFAFTHSDALVVPFFGKKAFLGTNPVSIAFPTENQDEPVCMDMATSIVPWNYIMNARREQVKVPLGVGVDEQGEDSDDPYEIRAVKPMAAHKGYALAFMVELLCSVLNGAAYGPNMTSMYQDLDKKRKLGSFVIAIDPRRFGGKDSFRQMATQMIRQVQQAEPDVLFPGQPEYLSEKERTEKGIPFSDALKNEFNTWAEKLGIATI